jgi:glycine/D-amino acid oxidase-like deaminating enzyme
MSEDTTQSHWQATARLSTAAFDDLPHTVDVAVIGGGLLGAATAYWLARAGADISLLERDTLAAGATGRNGGFMVAGTAEPYPAAIARLGHASARAVWTITLENRALLRRVLADETIDCDYREPGRLHLTLGEDQHANMVGVASALQTDHFATEVLDRQEVQTLIGTPLGREISGGLFAPQDGLLHPARLVEGLAAAARRHGARICTATEVVGIEPAGPQLLIRTTRGQLRAGGAVVATNAWTGQILPGLAHLVTPVRGQVLAYAPTAPVFASGMSVALTPTGEYWQQAPDGTIVLGGCRAVAPGSDIGVCESAPTPEVQTALEQILPRLFPSLVGLRVARRWAELMAFTTDYLPIVDRAPSLEHAWVVGGFCGHGMPFGMRLGQLLAEAALSGVAPAALASFRLDRPTLGKV